MAVGAAALTTYDLRQRRHAILRNFPLVGHFRYWLEAVGPELRQYIVTGNDEERPFSRDQRRWVYASSKKENNYFAFGTDNDLETLAELHHHPARAFPLHTPHPGEPGYDDQLPDPRRARCSAAAAAASTRSGRRRSINTSAMSYGSLSSSGGRGDQPRRRDRGLPAEHRRGRHLRYHRKGGDIIWQIGTGYFGCRDDRRPASTRASRSRPSPRTRFERSRSSSARARSPASAACCPPRRSRRRSRASAACRMGRDCISPAAPRRVLRRRLACSTSSRSSPTRPACRSASSRAVGDVGILARPRRGRWDGRSAAPTSSRSTAAKAAPAPAPLVFTDHVALPFKLGFSRGLQGVRRAGVSPTGSCSSARASSGFPRVGAARARARLRHDQRRARGDARDRLHPGAALPHRPLPDRRRDAEPVAHARPRPELKSARLANYLMTLRKDLLSLAGRVA